GHEDLDGAADHLPAFERLQLLSRLDPHSKMYVSRRRSFPAGATPKAGSRSIAAPRASPPRSVERDDRAPRIPVHELPPVTAATCGTKMWCEGTRRCWYCPGEGVPDGMRCDECRGRKHCLSCTGSGRVPESSPRVGRGARRARPISLGVRR